MASCERYEEALWKAAETGNIPADLQQHLDTCPACRESLTALQRTMTGFMELRRIPEHVPAVALAPLLPATRWWPRVAFAGALVVLAIAGISFWLARKQQVSVTEHRPVPFVQPEQLEQPEKPMPLIIEEPKKPDMPRIVQSRPAHVRHRRTARQFHSPMPIPVRQEQPSPEPQPLPVPAYDPVEALISAQPVNALTPLDATPLPTQALMAVSDLPVTYTLTQVGPEEMQQLLHPEATPEDGRTPGERTNFGNASLG